MFSLSGRLAVAFAKAWRSSERRFKKGPAAGEGMARIKLRSSALKSPSH
jgi:hypothetical protein